MNLRATFFSVGPLIGLASCVAEAAIWGQQPADPLSGGAGWVGTGLLGSVLAWLLFVHLPAKDKQINSMLERESKERELDRQTQHETTAAMQAAIADMYSRHEIEIEKDRDRVEKRLQHQSDEFKDALRVILEHCQKEGREVIAVFRSEIEKANSRSK